MPVKEYNNETKQYETRPNSTTAIKPNAGGQLSKPQDVEAEKLQAYKEGMSNVNFGSKYGSEGNLTDREQHMANMPKPPTTFDPTGGNPNITPYDPSGNVNAGYIGELNELGQQIPSFFGNQRGGGDGGLGRIDPANVGKSDYSQNYKDFSDATRNFQLEKLQNNPFDQAGLNVRTDDTSVMMQGEMSQLDQKAQSEGWLGTPQYAKAKRDTESKYQLMNQRNRTDYKESEMTYDAQQQQLSTQYQSEMARSEMALNELRSKEGMFNETARYNHAKARASKASQSVAQNLANKLKQYGMQRQNIFDRAGLEGEGLNWEKYQNTRNDNNYWAGVNKDMEQWGVEFGAQTGMNEAENQRATDEWIAKNTGGLFGGGGFLGTGL